VETTSHVRGVTIERAAEDVAGFLREVPNLPRWTAFFLRAGPADGGLYAMETALGPARTRIEEERRGDRLHLEIVSLFGPRRETATIDVEGRGPGSIVRFELRVPAGAPPDRVERLLAGLEVELGTLKRILEAPESTS
jgi:hypothetical protein